MSLQDVTASPGAFTPCLSRSKSPSTTSPITPLSLSLSPPPPPPPTTASSTTIASTTSLSCTPFGPFSAPTTPATTTTTSATSILLPSIVSKSPSEHPPASNEAIKNYLNLLSVYVQSLHTFFPTSPSTFPSISSNYTLPASPATPTNHECEPPASLKCSTQPYPIATPFHVTQLNPNEVIQQILGLLKKLKSVVEAQQERHLEIEKIKNLIVSEYEALSVQLFEQANALVKDERLLRHKVEQKLTLSRQKESEANQLVETLQNELNAVKAAVYAQQSDLVAPHAALLTCPSMTLPSLPSPPPLFFEFVRDLCDPTQRLEGRERKVMQSKFMDTLKHECKSTLPLEHFSWYQKSKFLNAIFHYQVAIDQTDAPDAPATCFTCHAAIPACAQHGAVFVLRMEEKGRVAETSTSVHGGWRICPVCRCQCVSVCQLLLYIRMQLQSVRPLALTSSSSPSSPLPPEPAQVAHATHAALSPSVLPGVNASTDEEGSSVWSPSDALVQHCWSRVSELRHQMYLTKLGITNGSSAT